MGYVTWFEGHLKLDKPLAPHHLAYLKAFSSVPHVEWDINYLRDVPDPLREAVGLPLGENGCYFTGHGFKEEYIYPPWSYGPRESDPAYLGGCCPGVPSLRCDWCPSDDGAELYDGADKFYGYIEWLQFLLDHFLIPWGYVMKGLMSWQGEFEEDQGLIVVTKNVLRVLELNKV